MISKELITKALFWKESDIYEELDDCQINSIDYKDNKVNVYWCSDETRGEVNEYNLYELGIILKEYLEDYAKEISLKGVWIDLNDLSKDETYYFKHCNEVFEGLEQYNLIMECEQ